MERMIKDPRLQHIFLQLVEMSKGNFSYKIPRSDNTDVIEAISATLNSVTEEIKDSFLHQGYVSMHDTYMTRVHLSILLDSNFIIVDTNDQFPELIKHSKSDLIGGLIAPLNTPESLKAWNQLKEQALKNSFSEQYITLTFKTKDQLELPLRCLFRKLLLPKSNTPHYLIMASEILKNPKIEELQLRQQIAQNLQQQKNRKIVPRRSYLNTSDIKKLREIGEYLKNSLDNRDLTLRDLSLMFGTNEYKLKRGFKELYGTTVFQFLKSERLRNAHVLIKNTEYSFKRIALSSGFKNQTHFSREFKARYGYTPTALRNTFNTPNT